MKIMIILIGMILLVFSMSNASAILLCGTGGTLTHDGDYCVHTFTANGTFVSPGDIQADALIIAGGGAGGNWGGGGGGAGGVIYKNGTDSLSLTVTSYPVVVGLGGAVDPDYCGWAGYGTPHHSGDNSSFDGLTAIGGGYGGVHTGAGNGGSGGGAGYDNGGIYGRGTAGQGYDGGEYGCGSSPYAGAGGGGASEVGHVASCGPGAGGNGLNISINGTWMYYAGGGGGGAYGGGGSSGGKGGGGGMSINGTDGLGGGGGGNSGSGCPGGGGDGVVIIRYHGYIPPILITYPVSTTYNIKPYELNWSADVSTTGCKYSIDNGITNISVNCGDGHALVTGEIGSSTWNIWGTLSGTEYNDYVNFNVNSCTPPSINNNWLVYFDNNCYLDDYTDLGTGNLSVIEGPGNFTLRAALEVHEITETCNTAPCYFVRYPVITRK